MVYQTMIKNAKIVENHYQEFKDIIVALNVKLLIGGNKNQMGLLGLQ